MPIALPADRAEKDKYLTLVGKTAFEVFTAKQRYIILFIRGDFTQLEAELFARKAFVEETMIPFASQHFQGRVDVFSIGVSFGLQCPENLKYVIEKYSKLQLVDCFEWHIIWHMLRRYLETPPKTHKEAPEDEQRR